MVSDLKALPELGSFAADAIDEGSVAFISWYRDGRLLTANPSFFKLAGYPEVEASGMRWPGDFTTPKFGENIAKAMDTLDRGAAAYEHEGELVRKDRTRVPVMVFIHAYRPPGGGQGWYYSFITDISRRVEDEKAIKKARDQAELYLAILTHDVNNLVQVGLGYLELGLDGMKKDGKITDSMLLTKPLDTLESIAGIIENVRALQKLGAGEFGHEPVDICPVLLKVRQHYSHYPGRSVTINYTPRPESFVSANPLIHEVFSNLVDNAIKHSPPEKPLTVNIVQSTVREEGRDYYKVAVEDNGPGIPDERKKQLFTRFSPGQPKTMQRGLGLYLVKALVSDYQGKVRVEDRVPGDYKKGARFVVLLPVLEKNERDPSSPG